MFDTTAVALATYTTTGYSAAINTGDGSQLSGQWVQFLVTNVLGIPNVKLIVQASPDGVAWFDNTTFDGSGSGSPLVNVPGIYTMLFQTRLQYWRVGWIFYANDPSDIGPGSGNSSSSSGQSAISSSSSGGTAAITFSVGLTPSYAG